MKQNQNLHVWLSVTIAGVIIAVVSGFFLGRSTAPSVAKSELQVQFEELQKNIPIRLAADSAAGGKTISLATGAINEDVDGLFILDHLTGGLQCWLLNPRTGDVGGIYVADVGATLGLDKGDPDFVMATGKFFFRQGRGNVRPANTICYVADGKSGKCAGFSLNYDNAGVQQGRVQQGELNVVCVGPIRQSNAIRE